eukprot:CAMPEP_0202002644 /NCGR_PEP_ID=MMETSP0905-20130828/8440_1 /ASSEMBLY_ACC=CAM_ASM_000554 /TAXON_ID=420261 /ORGANISM="Thalassiosira antarctica, Strain CCMP982" /LENGTH=270 /DNA_ID=CAMNT_0048559605 /DNA_START=15 /DNA_END=827 /DNA_ORIENTATION=+
MIPIFANLILRGSIPGDDNYDRDDILKHIGPLVTIYDDINKVHINIIKFNIGKRMVEGDDNSELWTPDSIFKELIPDQFINSRSILLRGLEDGLSVGGKQKISSLAKGAGVADAFRAIPLEALQMILFGKSIEDVEEVLAVLTPHYCKSKESWEGTADELIAQRNEQEQFFEGDFKRFLREEASKNIEVLEDFVQFCTGSNYIPFRPPDEKAFEIIVEFSSPKPAPGEHPFAHTCDQTIRLPGTMRNYENYDVFYEKMKEALAHSGFRMP